jgi:hypothetical protein
LKRSRPRAWAAAAIVRASSAMSRVLVFSGEAPKPGISKGDDPVPAAQQLVRGGEPEPAGAVQMNERRPLSRPHIADAKPVRLDETFAEPGCHCRLLLFSDVADVRQHPLAKQFERFHQLVGIFRARGLERQIDDAGADLFATLLQLRDDLLRSFGLR